MTKYFYTADPTNRVVFIGIDKDEVLEQAEARNAAPLEADHLTPALQLFYQSGQDVVLLDGPAAKDYERDGDSWTGLSLAGWR